MSELVVVPVVDWLESEGVQQIGGIVRRSAQKKRLIGKRTADPATFHGCRIRGRIFGIEPDNR